MRVKRIYTVNDVTETRALTKLGIDGIITNYTLLIWIKLALQGQWQIASSMLQPKAVTLSALQIM